MIATPTRPTRVGPRPAAVYGPPRKRLPRPTLFLYALILGALLLGGGSAWLLAPVHAEEPERYSPVSRGPRASYDTPQVQQWREAVEAFDWPADTALTVMACESQGDPRATNPNSGAKGLMQLLGWEPLAFRLFGIWDVYAPHVNIAVAYEIWLAAGRQFGTSMGWQASVGCWR